MKNLMSVICSYYPLLFKLEYSWSSNNKLALVEDIYGNKWVIKIFKDKDKMFRNLYIQSYLSRNKISPKILPTKNGNLFIEIDKIFIFVQEFLKPESNILTLNYHEIKEKTDILYQYLSKIKIINKNINRNEIYIEDTEFISYKNSVNILWDKINIKSYQYKPKSIQLIHGDLRPNNILFHKRNLYFIDFEYIRMGDPKVEQLKLLLLLLSNKNMYQGINNFGYLFNEEVFIQLALEIKSNNYLARNWKNINTNYRNQVIQEHLFIMKCITHYLKRIG